MTKIPLETRTKRFTEVVQRNYKPGKVTVIVPLVLLFLQYIKFKTSIEVRTGGVMKLRAAEVDVLRASYESVSGRTRAQNLRRSPLTLSEMFPSLL